jgi:hypothetical protein
MYWSDHFLNKTETAKFGWNGYAYSMGTVATEKVDRKQRMYHSLQEITCGCSLSESKKRERKRCANQLHQSERVRPSFLPLCGAMTVFMIPSSTLASFERLVPPKSWQMRPCHSFP